MLFSRKGSKQSSKSAAPPPPNVRPEPKPDRTDPWYGWAPSAQTPGSQVTRLDAERPPKLQRIVLQPGESVIGVLSMPAVRAGDEIKVDIAVTPGQPGPAKLKALLVRNGTGDGSEESFKNFHRLGSDPLLISVGGRFTQPHRSLRVEIKNVGESGAEFTAASPQVFVS